MTGMATPQSAVPPSPARPSYPSDRTRSARRRAQKAVVQDARQQHYTALAQRLMFVAEDLGSAEDGDLRAELLKVINRVRLRGSRTEQQDYEQVMEAVTLHACHCVEDIYDQTRISREQLWKILEGLVSTGQLEERNAQRGRERDDLDTLFFPTNTPGFSPLVRP